MMYAIFPPAPEGHGRNSQKLYQQASGSEEAFAGKPPHIRIADTASGMRADKTNKAPCSHRLNTTDICLYVRPHNLPNSIRNATHNANGSNVKFFHLIFLICFSLTPNSELEAYPLTKIIQNVGKTMELNKLLLDESAKEDRKCEILNTQNGSDGGRAAFMVSEERAAD